MKMGKKNTVLLLVTISFILITANSAANMKRETQSGNSFSNLRNYAAVTANHVPIYISGNEALANFIKDENLSGEGTNASPYIIENFIINASTAHGIEIQSTDTYLIIQNCTIKYGNSEYNFGIYLNNAINVNISNNNINDNKHGIYLEFSCNNTLSGNNVSYNNNYGIYLGSSFNNTLVGNILTNNIDGIRLEFSCNNTLSGNTVTFSNSYGIYLKFSNNNNTLSGNIATKNDWGIKLTSSNNNTLSGNIASHNNYEGIRLESSNNNTLSGNNATNNIRGIILYSSNITTLSGNNASYNSRGIIMWYSNNSILSGNIICGNRDGIYLYSSSNNNSIYFNAIYENILQAYEKDDCIGNQWDNGTTGNWWAGEYKKDYPSATNDGTIWSIPYEISGSGSGIDNFPLVNCIITVFEHNKPQFTHMPEDFGRYEGYSGQKIVWMVTDGYPDTYTIELNGNEVVSATVWTSGKLISYNITDGMLESEYNITILVTDESGNIAQDTVIFTVTSIETTTIDETTDDTTDITPGFTLMVAISAGIFLFIRSKKIKKNI